MPKMKTKKAAAKRFKFSATGKIKFKRVNKRHDWAIRARLASWNCAVRVSFSKAIASTSKSACPTVQNKFLD